MFRHHFERPYSNKLLFPFNICKRRTKRVEEWICESSDEYAEEYDAHAAKVLGRIAALPIRALFRAALLGLAELTATPAGRNILLGWKNPTVKPSLTLYNRNDYLQSKSAPHQGILISTSFPVRKITIVGSHMKCGSAMMKIPTAAKQLDTPSQSGRFRTLPIKGRKKTSAICDTLRQLKMMMSIIVPRLHRMVRLSSNSNI